MKKFIDYIVVGVVLTTVLGISGGMIKKSYDEYQIYYEENFPEIDPCDKATLLDIDAEWQSGVTFYRNNKAKPTKEDVLVMGTWKEETEEGKIFTHPLDPKKRPYEVIYDDFFSANGGDVVVKYQDFIDTIRADLVDVELASLEVTHGPYRHKYSYGEYFDKTGIRANAVYNDGTKVSLSLDQIIVDNNHALNSSDKQIVIAYEENGKFVSSIIKIQVKSSVKDGKVVAIDSDGLYGTIGDKQTIQQANMDVCAVYESGNRKLLTPYEYTIANEDKHAYLGVQNYAEVIYKTNDKIKGKIPLTVTSRIEGENGYIIGGSRKTEKEYTFSNGTFKEVGNITFGGNFGKTVTNGGEAYAAYIYYATAPGYVDISLRCGNSNLFKSNDKFYMRPLQINTIMDLYINDTLVNVDDDVVLSGCGPHSDDAPLYNVYSTFTFKNIPFRLGNNKVTFKFKKSTVNELTYYDETPSTLNIDYVDAVANGIEIPDDTKFKEVYLDRNFKVNFGDNFDSLSIPLYGVYGNENRKILITDKFANITKPSGYADIGNHTIRWELYNNPSMSGEKTFTVGDLILEAENATKKGTEAITTTKEAEYILDPLSNRYSKGKEITAIKGMDNSATNHGILGETSLTFSFNAAPGSHRLIVKASNTNFFVAGNGKGYTKSIDMNQVIDIYINGTKINYSAIMPSITDADHDDWCWMGFFMLDCGLIELNPGKNTIKLQAKTGGSVPKNKWDEYAIPRFDFIKITLP